MERTKNKSAITSKQLQTLASALVSRSALASRLGIDQYSGNRDLYQALGYPKELKFEDYYSRYKRQDIAKAMIDRPVKATWQGPLQVMETTDLAESEFEKAWANLMVDMKLKTIFSRVDKLASLGRYGVLLLGFDDVSSPEAFVNPIKKGKRTLKYIRPFSEKTATILEYETDTKNERYGLPKTYNIQFVDSEGGAQSVSLSVHYSRVIHITLDILESEIFGVPVMEAIYNRLADIEKLVGGDAEMFWRGARPGYAGNVDKDFQMTPQMEADLLSQVDEFENNLRRILINQGVTMEELAQQIADPKPHVDVQMQMLSAETGIPKRILTGSERGELASAQDASEWLSYIQARREEHAEWNIVRPFIDKMIECGVLPAPADGKYILKWPDLFALSEQARVEIGFKRSQALKEYSMSPIAEAIIPPNAFKKYFLGFSKEDNEMIDLMQEEAIENEQLFMDLIPQEQTTTPTSTTTPSPASKPKPQRTK